MFVECIESVIHRKNYFLQIPRPLSPEQPQLESQEGEENIELILEEFKNIGEEMAAKERR